MNIFIILTSSLSSYVDGLMLLFVGMIVNDGELE